MTQNPHLSLLKPVPRSDVQRLWYAVAATALFFVIVIAQGAVRPEYDVWQQAVSALSLGPGAWVQQLNFAMLGLVLLSTTFIWRRILIGGRGAIAYPALTALTALSLIAIAFVPQDPAPGYDPEQLGHALPTATGLAHLGLAAVCSGCSVAGMFVLASRFSSTVGWRGWPRYSRTMGGVTILCVLVYAVWSTQPSGLAGLFERLAIILPGTWGFTLVCRLSSGAPFTICSVDSTIAETQNAVVPTAWHMS